MSDTERYMLKTTTFLFSILMLCSSCGNKAIVPQIKASISLDQYKTLLKSSDKLSPIELTHFDNIITDLKVPSVFESPLGKPLKANFISDVLEARGADSNFLILELFPARGFKNYSTVALIEPVNSETLFSVNIKGQEITSYELRTIEIALANYIDNNTSPRISLN